MKSRSNKQSQLAKARKRYQRRRCCRLETLEERRLLAGDFVEGSLLVQFHPTASPAERSAAISSVGGTVARDFAFVNGAQLSVSAAADEAALAAQLRTQPGVKFAGLDQIAEPFLTPNDPLFDLQWGLNNIGQNPLDGTPDADIDAPEAWDIFTGTDEVVIAVIDSGIDYTHEDLIPNLWENPFEIPGNGIDDDLNGFIDDRYGANFLAMTGDPLDDASSHGTHVSGTAAAVGDNGIGGTGVHWNAKIMALKAIPGSSAAVVDAIDYMIDMKSKGVNIVVSNNSWGFAPGATFDPLLFDAISASIDAGIPFVAAAGNDTNNNDNIFSMPSGFDLDGIIAVAATDKDDVLAGFSNFGVNNVDLAGPGVEVLSSVTDAFSTANPMISPFPGYSYFDGTSMASPHVAGAVALAANLNPSLSVAELKDLVLSTVDVIPDLVDDVVSGGRLNVGRMLEELPSGEIRGTVFEDANGNGRRDVNELPLGGITVFVDLNEDGVRQANEQMAVSQFDGSYVLKHFTGPGTFEVVEVIPPGFEPTNPADGSNTVTFTTFDQVIRGVNFGLRQQAVTVSGAVRQDNGDPLTANPGVAGLRVFADLDTDGRADIGEPSDTTDGDGNYVIELPGAGSYEIVVDLPPGWTQQLPADDAPQLVDLIIGTPLLNVDFLLDGQMFDFGSAPAPYPPASAGLLPGFQLGELLFGEATQAASDESDADGVSHSTQFSAGALVGSTVHAKNNDNILPRGYFNAWVDWNQDQEWTPDEQIYRNERLGEGIHTLAPFTVPAGAMTGATFARYRYGWEYNQTPDANAQAGEIEDVMVNVFGSQPVAVPDFETVEQDSDPTTFFPLVNDFVSAAGGTLRILAGETDTMSAQGGTVVVTSNSTLTYEPPPGFFSTDSFSYTITDDTGATASGVVTVEVTPKFDGPLAVDDFEPMVASSPAVGPLVTTNIRVQDNDIPAPGMGVVTTLSLISEAPDNGTAVVFNNGTPGNPADDVVSYTPDAGFIGTDQFEYQLSDNQGRTSRATVTVNVGTLAQTAADDLVRYSVTYTDPQGNPISEIGEGVPFLANVFVEDLRLNPVFPPLPSAQVDRRGVFASFIDVTYDRLQLTVVGDLDEIGPVFDVETGMSRAGGYQVFFTGSTAVPGIVDEAGGIASGGDPEDPPGADNRKLMFSIPLRANPGTAGQLATLQTDPANLLGVDDTDDINEVSGQHDTLLYEPSDDVEVSEMRLDSASIPIVPGAASEGEAHNRLSPTDVNNDRITDLLDLRDTFASLLVEGPGPIAGAATSGAAAEGEPSGARRQLMVDVDNDGFRTAADLQQVFATLLVRFQPASSSPAASPPEAEPADIGAAATADEPAPLEDNDSGPPAVDLLLASGSTSRSGSSSSDSTLVEELGELDDDFFADISDIWN